MHKNSLLDKAVDLSTIYEEWSVLKVLAVISLCWLAFNLVIIYLRFKRVLFVF